MRKRKVDVGRVIMPLTSTARIVGATGSKTLNSVALDSGHSSNVRCGADILLNGMYSDMKGEAVCPVCGAKIGVSVEGQRVVSVIPQSAVLHYLTGSSGFSIFCESTFIFDRDNCLRDWLRSYKGDPGNVCSLPEFLSKALAVRGPQVTGGPSKF